MKKYFFKIFIFTIGILVGWYLQDKNQPTIQLLSQKENTDIECYKDSNLEINICSNEIKNHTDSILNKKLDSLFFIINERLKVYKQFNDTSEYYHLKRYKTSIIESQQDWESLMLTNRKVQEIYYENGRLQPYYGNIQNIKDSKYRILFIEKLINENK